MELLAAVLLCGIGVLCVGLAVSAKELTQVKHRLYHLHSLYQLERLRADTLYYQLQQHRSTSLTAPLIDKE